MHSLYSIEKMMKQHEKDIADEINNYELVKTSQSNSPGIISRKIDYFRTYLGEILRGLKCAVAQKTVTFFKNTNTEINPC